ncbi:MAG: 23S rRNA (adenine(2503)-C(2))-methyltransferase RlmN [Erysipelotrichaceae bacterium]|nr:23S rRNA (adenine(2503)-C(2))-methyltransferase RlmN [Erysipelotrichaceae bacterium]
MLIYDYNLEDLENYLKGIGLKPFRAKQIFRWLYEKRVDSFFEMSDISKSLQEKLAEDFDFMAFKVRNKQVSKDGTVKFLFELADGALIESVMMVFEYGYSACLSSQVGCNMGCKFCASGLLKKQRDLTAGEIVLQALTIQKYLDAEGKRLDNLVIMGTGEPFDNYDNLMKGLSIINSPFGLQIGARHISISTCGLVPMIRRFAEEKVQYNLAISLHAANNELRNQIMPVNRAYDLEELMDAISYYSTLNNRRITFEYLLIDGLNNSKKDADDIAKYLKGKNAYINLIPYNEVKENPYKSTSEEKTLEFYDMLKKRGISVTLRQKRGTDIDAACGQLRAKEMLNA